jgi:DNA repair protein RadC
MTYCLRIVDIPTTERPRERLIANGPKILATAELIAILLGTGQDRELSAVGLGQFLLQELGKHQRDPLTVLRDVSVQELMQISGIGPAKQQRFWRQLNWANGRFNPVPQNALQLIALLLLLPCLVKI